MWEVCRGTVLAWRGRASLRSILRRRGFLLNYVTLRTCSSEVFDLPPPRPYTMGKKSGDVEEDSTLMARHTRPIMSSVFGCDLSYLDSRRCCLPARASIHLVTESMTKH